jgi:hypothetical protein
MLPVEHPQVVLWTFHNSKLGGKVLRCSQTWTQMAPAAAGRRSSDSVFYRVGMCRKDVIRDSARKEFEASAEEKDPQIVRDFYT